MGHIDDEVLEQYATRRLAEPELGRVEEHLLICEDCRDRLQKADSFISAMRSALTSDPRATGVAKATSS